MDRLKKVIEDELKNLDVEERNLLRRTALSTINSLIDIVGNRMENFERSILDFNGRGMNNSKKRM